MISTNLSIPTIQMPLQTTAQNQPAIAIPSNGMGGGVGQSLIEADSLVKRMQAAAQQNEANQKAKEAQEAQKAQQIALQQQYISALPANAQANASQGTPPSGTSPTSSPSVMPRSASMPATASASENPNTVDQIGDWVKSAWTQGQELISKTAQSATQLVTGAPAQAATIPPNAVAMTSQTPALPAPSNASPANSTGSKSDTVAQAAKGLEGSSSKAGPGGGNVACAWKTAKALRAAGYDIKAGSPEEINVNAQVAFLKKKGATVIPKSEARPGDIVFVTGKHIGIVTAGQGTQAQVTSNSSSKAKFSWKSNLNFDGQYGKDSQILRLA